MLRHDAVNVVPEFIVPEEKLMIKAAGSLFSILFVFFVTPVFAVEANGTGSMIVAPLLRVWAESYTMYSKGSSIKYQGSNPADGLKKISNKEVEFGIVDMPLRLEELQKLGLVQFPVALGSIAPVVNLPNVYPGQLKLDGQVFGDILLGVITKWNHPAIAALNPSLKLPDASIIVVHRVSPPGISTVMGDYLSKTHANWKSIKGDGMAGEWPAKSIEVKNPEGMLNAVKGNQYSIGYGPIAHFLKHSMSYAQLRNKAGKFVSPSDENVEAAAENADWNVSNGFAVVLTEQPGENSWPLSMAAYALMLKNPEYPERSKEVLKYFKYSLRYGKLKAVQNDYIALPDSVRTKVDASWESIVDAQGVPLLKK